MPWNNPVIDGDDSVAANKTPLNQNSAYTETTMQKDHFWDDATSSNDGRHNVVQMPNQSSDPSLGTGMKGAVYCKEVSEVKGGGVNDELFFKNATNVFQISGVQRAQYYNASLGTTAETIVASLPNNTNGILMSNVNTNVGWRFDYFFVDSSGNLRINILSTVSSQLQPSASGTDLQIAMASGTAEVTALAIYGTVD